MKERPIIFSESMVKAILEGRKTQTRRIIPARLMLCETPEDEPQIFVGWCNYGGAGDHLWVRETYQKMENGYDYKADYPDRVNFRWKPSIFMPRAASRLTLEIERVRVQQIQNITLEDCLAEGVPAWQKPAGVYEDPRYPSKVDPRQNFITLWNILNGKRGFGWEKNPWVWALDFKIITRNWVLS